jgi:hypothetical protein
VNTIRSCQSPPLVTGAPTLLVTTVILGEDIGAATTKTTDDALLSFQRLEDRFDRAAYPAFPAGPAVGLLASDDTLRRTLSFPSPASSRFEKISTHQSCRPLVPSKNANGLYSVPRPFQLRLSPPQANPGAWSKIKFACGFQKLPRQYRNQAEGFEYIGTCCWRLTVRSREKRAVPDAGSTYTGGGRRAMNFPASESHASMRGCCAPARAAIARKQLVESAYRFTSRICARRARAWKRCGLRCLNGEAAPERFPTPHSPLAANRLDVRLIF